MHTGIPYRCTFCVWCTQSIGNSFSLRRTGVSQSKQQTEQDCHGASDAGKRAFLDHKRPKGRGSEG